MEEDGEVLGESENEQEGELRHGGVDVARGAYQQQHLHRAAYHEGTWCVDVSQGSARSALCFLAFMSISSYEAAVGDGSLLNAFAAVLSCTAAQEVEEGSDVAHAGSVGDPLAVASWGGTLQLALQLPESLEQQVRTLHGPSSSSSAGDSRSSSSEVVRLVLVQG